MAYCTGAGAGGGAPAPKTKMGGAYADFKTSQSASRKPCDITYEIRAKLYCRVMGGNLGGENGKWESTYRSH